MSVRKVISCSNSHRFLGNPGPLLLQGIEIIEAVGETNEEAESKAIDLTLQYNWSSDSTGKVWDCGRHK